ncbi:MAG TPA: cupin domain-containing protein [Gemmatimonadales bacterium]|nr:cupin domain-containing protein [Gemmatimonadales bacterium]
MSQPEERLRPHPSERLSGPAVLLNLPEFTQALYAEPRPSKQGHRQVSLVHRGPLRLVLFALEPGGELPEHRAPGHVVIHCLRGQIEVEALGARERMEANEALVLDPDVPHTVKALTQSEMLLTVCLDAKPQRPPETR